MLSDKHIFKKITLKASIEELWHRWTTNEGVKSFFAPQCEVQLSIGGKYEMYFLLDNPKGLQGSEGCKVLSFLPNQMLSFSWNAPPEYEKVRGKHTWVVLMFNRVEDNLTNLELYHLGWQRGNQWDSVYKYFETAWDVVFQRLEESISQTKIYMR